jgi:hypothetical protein
VSRFTDASGLEWSLELDAFLLDRIEKDAKVDLADVSASGLLAVDRDVKALVRVLAVACAEQLKERHKSAADFAKQIRKEAITQARVALLESIADFFPKSEWSEMQSNLVKRKAQPDMTPEQLQLAAGFMTMDPEVQKGVMELIQQETAAAGSLQSSPDNASVYDSDVTLSIPADDSLENAGAVPEDIPSETSG